jgi:acetyl-CoA carboxylase biotin carboxylase subunit
MIKKILIANRGEIAVRIIKAATEMGIESIAVYSEADTESLHVKLADRAIKIGPAPVTDSYLYYQNILSAAAALKVDAIHPGYGFFAENPAFVEACNAHDIIFIGPSAEIIEQMGNKSNARKIMKESGVPVIPGSEGVCNNLEEVKQVVEMIGYPVIVKASSGGGGKGMRLINNESELENGFNNARAEAENAFSDSSVYIERYIADPKHIEVQIIADQLGNAVHLFERDCSIQRKHQKLLEESPSPVLSDKERQIMYDAAIEAVKSVGYFSAGTIEFLFDQISREIYFIEMNTRIQVEHPVTEAITGIDLIKEQIKVANNQPLSVSQEDLKINGHSIECRINAEDSEMNFAPSPGLIREYIEPLGSGIRIDSGVYSGYKIPPFYDSMIAKIIVQAQDRNKAIEKMKTALNNFVITGIKTTIPFHKKLLNNTGFIEGTYTTSLLNK